VRVIANRLLPKLACTLIALFACSHRQQAAAQEHGLVEPEPRLPPAPAPEQPCLRWYGHYALAAVVALPYGREGSHLGEATPGLLLGVRFGMTPLPISLGLEAVFAGGLGSSVVEARVFDEREHRDVDLSVNRSVSLFRLALSARLQPTWPEWLPVRPFIEGLIGFQSTSNVFSGRLHGESVRWHDDGRLTGDLGWGYGLDLLIHGNGVFFAVQHFYGPGANALHALMLANGESSIQYDRPTSLTTFTLGFVGTFAL
jgi:hypothetical protein